MADVFAGSAVAILRRPRGDDATERRCSPRIGFAAEDVASAPRGGRIRGERRRRSTSPTGGRRYGAALQPADWVCRGKSSVRPPWRTYSRAAPSPFYVAHGGTTLRSGCGKSSVRPPWRTYSRAAPSLFYVAHGGTTLRSGRGKSSVRPPWRTYSRAAPSLFYVAHGGTTLRSGLAARGFCHAPPAEPRRRSSVTLGCDSARADAHTPHATAEAHAMVRE